MEERLLELEKELEQLRKDSGEVFSEIINTRKKLDELYQKEKQNYLESFTKFFENSEGKVVKVSGKWYDPKNPDNNFEEYYIGEIPSKDEELEFYKQEPPLDVKHVLLKNVIMVKPGLCEDTIYTTLSTITRFGFWGLHFEMLYPNPSKSDSVGYRYKAEFITKEEANEFILSNTSRF